MVMILASVTHDPKWASRVKSVFDTRAGSGYKDDIPFKYYFAIVTSRKRSVRWATGSSIESHDGAEVGRATSLWRRSPALNAILPIRPHSYAIVTDLLAFEDVVPPRRDIGFYETMLSDLANPSRIGAALQVQRSNQGFMIIVCAGTYSRPIPSAKSVAIRFYRLMTARWIISSLTAATEGPCRKMLNSPTDTAMRARMRSKDKVSSRQWNSVVD